MRHHVAIVMLIVATGHVADRRRCWRCGLPPAILSFLPMVWGAYQIIDLGPDYDYAVVGTPDRSYLWILARRSVVEPELYRRLVDRVREQ